MTVNYGILDINICYLVSTTFIQFYTYKEWKISLTTNKAGYLRVLCCCCCGCVEVHICVRACFCIVVVVVVVVVVVL